MTGASTRFRGFTLPLTLALAFSIMAVASGLTGMVTVRAKAARQRDNDVYARITLESAVQAGLARLEAAGVPQTDRWESVESLNGRTVRLTFMAVRYSADINDDPPETVVAAIPNPALQAMAVKALTTPGDPPSRAHFMRLRDFLTAAGAQGSAEDCLRGLLTLGRQTGAPDPRPARTALRPEAVALLPGDTVVVRAALGSAKYQDVLWERVRFTGQKGVAWHIHDWRQLRLAPDAHLCPPPAA
ncbi:hypothetical protein QO010_003540 [Caulobacter ginsengisoli]|uniref:Uncharacterized protein n=1 Tax=Caulobacter ginsengisoli TaxID=400775 RepID=A0ABU0IX29_9CAUL|nr:hypothetical protein [Caulobacter ginsengisoli]MDQ0465748.1 hypothetical protein [Caulobacter ginsengisoli]